MLKHVAVSFGAPALILAQAASAQEPVNVSQRAGLYAKPAVVRVMAGCSGTFSFGSIDYPFTVGEVGTGYFISPDGEIMTSYHILRSGGEDGCREAVLKYFVQRIYNQKSFDSLPEETKIDIRNRSQTVKDIQYFSHVILPTGDLFPFEIERSGASNRADGKKDVAVIKIQIANAPTLQFGDSSTAKSQASATVIGYPIEADLQPFLSEFFSQDVPSNEPIGEATAINGRISNGQSNSGNPSEKSFVLQLNERLPLGSLGSPVVNQTGEVIGMVTPGEADFRAGSSTSVAIPGNAVKPFAGDRSRVNPTNLTDRLYREGLELFWQGKFQAARMKFRSVKELFPYHLEATALSNESEYQLAQMQANKSRTLWLLSIAVVAGGLLVAYGVYALIQRHRHRRQLSHLTPENSPPVVLSPPEPATLPPAPEPPQVLIDADRDSGRSQFPKQAAMTQISGKAGSPATVIGTQPFIELRNQAGQVRRFYLNRECHCLGRDRAWADLYIPDDGWDVVSRCHAVLEREAADYRIYDGDRQHPSTNGIFLDSIPIHPQEGHLLQDGDQIQTGHDPRNQVILTYSNPGSRQPSSPHLQLNSRRSED